MTADRSGTVISLSSIRAACKECSLRELCLPMGLSESDMGVVDKIVKRGRAMKKGEYVYRMGEPLQALYAIRAGSVKTTEITRDGQIQIMGFHLPGELLGIDAISDDRHPCDAIALETTDLCEIPFYRLEELAHEIPGLQRQLLRLMSREIVRDESLLVMLGRLSAEARLAACLVSFSRRLEQLGRSGTIFKMTMSRQDLADYLGLALETVSRLFSRFQEDALLAVQGRSVRLLDMNRLQELAEQSPGECSHQLP